MCSLERTLRYSHVLTRHCSSHLLLELAYPKHEYRWPTLRPPCDDAITMKNTFFCIIWNDLFISEVKMKPCFIFRNFQNGRHFEVATNFFTAIDTENWICQPDSHQHFRYFELLIDPIPEIVTEIYQFQNLTYLVSWWPHRWRHECTKHILHN